MRTAFTTALATLATCATALAIAGPAQARPDQPAPGPATATGGYVTYAVDTTGSRIPVVIRETTHTLDPATGSAVATIDIRFFDPATTAESLAAAAPLTSGSPGGCWEDSPTYAAEVCLHQYYNDLTSGGRRYVQVTKYTAAYLREDSQYQLVAGAITAGVFGYCLSGCTSQDQTHTTTWTNPTQAATYTYTPTWSPYYVTVDGSDYQCAYSTITMHRGSGTLTFRSPDVCQGAAW